MLSTIPIPQRNTERTTERIGMMIKKITRHGTSTEDGRQDIKRKLQPILNRHFHVFSNYAPPKMVHDETVSCLKEILDELK